MSDAPPLADRYPPGPGTALVALGAGVAGLAGSYALAGLSPSFVAAPVEVTLSRQMPEEVVNFAITQLGDLGQQLNFAMAATLVALLFALLVGLSIGIGRQLDSRAVAVWGAFVTVWIAATTLTVAPLTALGAAMAVLVVVSVPDLLGSGSRATGDTDPNGRRQVVAALGTAAGLSAVGAALGREGTTADVVGGDEDVYASVDPPSPDVDDATAAAAERQFDAISGTEMEPLLSENFYTTDISSVDPTPNAADWTLTIRGEVDEPATFTYDDLLEMDFEHRFVSLRCVGEGLNGKKMDTAVWSGVPVDALLDEVETTGECNCVMGRAVDKYHVEFPVEAMTDGLLALSMNGEPLPRQHGAPARLLVPGHWGEVNVKWITDLQLLNRARDGYWEKRGWQGTGPVKTVAKLKATTRTEDDRLVVGGHAYAGTRGIERVEVSTDGGDTWSAATLTDRLPGAFGSAVDDPPEHARDAWRQWRYEYDSPGDSHEVVVRAVDGTGTVQTEEESGPVPSGPTGWVSERVDPDSL